MDQQTVLAQLLLKTQSQYPVVGQALQSFDVRLDPKDDSGRVLEFYEPGDSWSFDPQKPSLQLFGNTVKPSDIAGDVTSHYLRTRDPTVQRYYRGFENSLTTTQQKNLLEQYHWAQQNEGEKRSYGDWLESSGLPAYFRGYAFGQWHDPQHWYTPQQMQQFDGLLAYLKGQ